MKKKITILFFVFLTLFLMSSSLLTMKESSSFKLLNYEKSFIAGSKITVVFKANAATKPQLVVIHSYGKTILNGEFKYGKLTFTLPSIYSNKSGKVDWFLVNQVKIKSKGTFEILPNNQTKTVIENYLGPPSTLVGDGHFVMYVAIPTDSFDNPKTENTPVIFKSQFLNTYTNETILTNNLIAWKDFYAPTKSGNVLVSAECNKTITKEYDAVIYPGIATDFTISFTRNHEFADGNQITTLKTSIIKDKFGNVVSNGTMVSFMVTTQNTMVLKSFGTTIEGVATAKILHPDHQDIYTIKAFVTGTAESNSIAINYKPINPKIEYEFSNYNRMITVGPIRSFMNQLVPDGIKITLKIYHKNQVVETLEEVSSKGKVKFSIPKDYYKKNSYSFEISTLGSTQKIQEKKYDNHQ